MNRLVIGSCFLFFASVDAGSDQEKIKVPVAHALTQLREPIKKVQSASHHLLKKNKKQLPKKSNSLRNIVLNKKISNRLFRSNKLSVGKQEGFDGNKIYIILNSIDSISFDKQNRGGIERFNSSGNERFFASQRANCNLSMFKELRPWSKSSSEKNSPITYYTRDELSDIGIDDSVIKKKLEFSDKVPGFNMLEIVQVESDLSISPKNKSAGVEDWGYRIDKLSKSLESERDSNKKNSEEIGVIKETIIDIKDGIQNLSATHEALLRDVRRKNCIAGVCAVLLGGGVAGGCALSMAIVLYLLMSNV